LIHLTDSTLWWLAIVNVLVPVNVPRHIKGVQFTDQLSYNQVLQKHLAPYTLILFKLGTTCYEVYLIISIWSLNKR
jgi:hypothetical protein